MKPLSVCSIALATLVVACGGGTESTGVPPAVAFSNNPCNPNATVQLAVAQSARIDCSAGGATITLAGGGASYLVVPQLATNQVPLSRVSYSLASGSLPATSMSVVPSHSALAPNGPQQRPMAAQRRVDQLLRARAPLRATGISMRSTFARAPTVPQVGSVRSFHVAANFDNNTYTTVGAKLVSVGDNVMIYIDTLAPADGFTSQQLATFGALFDQTLYPIDTAAFGSPVDRDQNGHIIMLLSPVVNAGTPRLTCLTQGYVAGYFDPGDFSDTDPNSNHGEIFYGIVPDTFGSVSCGHTVGSVGLDVPATFIHELQHLISYSTHVVRNGAAPASTWMDEGMSIVAEELGSLYYEQRCPRPKCRVNPDQMFPDSASALSHGFFFDSYQFAYNADSSSLTLYESNNFPPAVNGGEWLMLRWLGDQFGAGIFRKLETGPSEGVADIEAASGQSFGPLFANFGVALFADSLPGLPRATAPVVNRFATRNVRALWAGLYALGHDIPLAFPIDVKPITTDTVARTMAPGAMSFYRLDTPANASTVTIRFSAPNGAALASALKPQVAVFRLPPGQ